MGKRKQFSVITNFQIIFWLAFVFVSVYSFSQNAPVSTSIIRTLLLIPLHAALFYTCYFFLIPYFFEKKKYISFLALLVLVLSAVTALRLLLKNNIFDLLEGGNINIGFKTQLLIIIISELAITLISSLMRVAKDRYEYEKKYQQAQTLFLQSELNYLKSQVSPHFLLNTLNNIYSFAVTNSTETPNAVLKLSEILKYFLYESSRNKIAVGRELDIIQSYIDLFRLRFRDNLAISVNFNITKKEKEIEPLLLMSLVENAFKHSGIGMQDDAFITITAEETEDNKLIFCTQNSKTTMNETIGQYGGIGLQNISKRLSLNYPDNHELFIDEGENSFSVKMIIPFL
jgi:two-component system, LytTR family, sensor kinase